MVEHVEKPAGPGRKRRPVQERILQSAARVFGQRGYTGASIKEIAAAAGSTKPTVYSYFANKKALYEATLEWVHAVMMERQEAAASGTGPIYERILAVLRVKMAFAREYADLIRVAHSSMYAPAEARPEIDPVRQWDERFGLTFRLVKEGVARGELQGDPMDVALVIADTFGSLALAQALFPSMPVLQAGIEERLWKVIYEGARKR